MWWINENNVEKNGSSAASGSIPIFMFQKCLKTCHDSRYGTSELSLNRVE